MGDEMTSMKDLVRGGGVRTLTRRHALHPCLRTSSGCAGYSTPPLVMGLGIQTHLVVGSLHQEWPYRSAIDLLKGPTLHFDSSSTS